MIKLTQRYKRDNHWDIVYENMVKLGELIMDVDGFYVWFPENNGGFWEAHVLREIADHMDELNEPWQKDIEKYFETETTKNEA